MKRGEHALAVFAVGLLILMAAIVAQVICSALDVNPLAEFTTDWALIGGAVTLNSLLDLQWHLLVVAGLLPTGLVWLRDVHVRVDFLYQNRSRATRARINLIGNLLFATPFLALALPASWNFMIRAWTSDEGSRNGGLNDLWLVKTVLPLGLALLAIAILFETLRLIRVAR
ncbi:TRAP transporter small permease subunit [Rhodophyticola sp. CCM32]|uniref:TRAP transporter small permease subunit n=1 Tax=Rhodophyticola sp. CCM32 TaxID=2916397 RepID=UPI00107F02A8|nr:TRAP transporter small permease subunit [Rhodophyticola sp. CCM32]QBY01354.1 TRAP transporter small permease subunit [Rhodophyticola sp. CCM32]